MDLRTLRAFAEVVRQGGFSQAAKAVNATQPTISKAVKQLEDEVGALLLDRLGHRVRPTAMGEVVYRRALAMLAEREHLVAELAELRGLKRGRLGLGLPMLGSSILFAPLMAQYRRRYPAIDIHLIEHGSIHLEQAVLAGEVELAVSLLPVSEVFSWQAVRDDPLMVLLPPGHRLEGRERVRLDDLADCPFVLFEAGFVLNQMIRDACRKHGFQPQEAASSGQPDFIAALVAAGLGVALLPRLTTEQWVNLPVRTALLDEEDLRWRAAVIWRRGASLSPAAKAWLELLHEKSPPATPRAHADSHRP